jgi:hypothetical protein
VAAVRDADANCRSGVCGFERSAEKGGKESRSETIESADDCGKLRLTGKRVTQRVRKDAGEPRFLEVTMKALREIRDLFKIGAEAESKLGAVRWLTLRRNRHRAAARS